MKAQQLLLLGALVASIPTPLATAKNAPRGRSHSPACSLQCPPGFVVAIYSWEIQAQQTVYDEQGQEVVPPDGVWRVNCALRCEQRAVNQETKVWEDKKMVCESGGEPSPYRGPWRITGKFNRKCAALANNGCGMQCYEVRVAKPPRKKGGKPAAAK